MRSAAGRFLQASGATFTPLSLSPILWLDASDTSTITSAANRVSAWADKSGNGNNASQSTAGLKPTTNTTTMNGKNVLDFSSNLIVTSSFLIHPATTTFIVFTSSSSAAQIFMEHGPNWNTSSGEIFFINSATQYSFGYNRGGAAPLGGNSAILTTRTSGAHQLSFVTDGTYANGLAWQDAAALTKTLTYSNTVSTSATAVLNIGDRAGGAVLPLAGSLAEIIIYNSSLSTANRQTVEAYLKAKWGTP